MQVHHLSHQPGRGWSGPLPTDLDSADTLVLAFGAPQAAPVAAALDELAAAFPNSALLGCSSAGEMAGPLVHDDSLSVAVARFERTRVRRVATPLAGAGDSHAAGRRLAAQLPAADLRAVFLLSSGMAVNGAALVAGLSEGLPPEVTVTGGLAGDGSRFQRTWVLDQGRALEHGVAAVGLYGSALQMGHGCDGGWQDFGPERTITKSEGGVLYELDGQPALALYKTYLGDLADRLPGSALLFPLSVRAPQAGSRTLVRTILAIDEATQSMTFAGDMPQGGKARLMRTSVDRLVGSAEEAAGHALAGLQGAAAASPVLAVSVSCIGRRLVMGERTEEEVEAVADRLPAGSAHAGFYSYGEIAPANGSTQSDLHNQTMTVTVFSEG